MDQRLPVLRNPHSRPDIIKNLAEHLLQHPQDIVDAKRLIKNFQASANEFHQALQLIDPEPPPPKFI